MVNNNLTKKTIQKCKHHKNINGPKGKSGPTGPLGPTGPSVMGPIGPVGPIGPTGFIDSSENIICDVFQTVSDCTDLNAFTSQLLLKQGETGICTTNPSQLVTSKLATLDPIGGTGYQIGDLVTLSQTGFTGTTVHKLLCHQWEWQVSIDSLENDDMIEITNDKCGNVYVAGRVGDTGTTSVAPVFYNSDGSIGFIGQTGERRIVLGKLDTYGVWDWQVYIAILAIGAYFDTQSINLPFDIKVDDCDQYIYITSYFFETGTPIYYNKDGNTGLNGFFGTNQVFLGKISTNGVWEWNVSINNASSVNQASTLEIDGSDVYVAHNISNSTLPPIYYNKDGSAGIVGKSGNVDEHIYLGKIDQNGFWEWSVTVDDTQSKFPTISISNDAIYLSGSTNNDTRAPGYYNKNNNLDLVGRTTTDGFSIFMGKLNPNGYWEWNITVSPSILSDIRTDLCDNIYLVGRGVSGGSAPKFYNKDDELELTGITGISNHIYVAKLSSTGYWNWNATIDSVASDNNPRIEIDTCNNAYVTAYQNSGSTSPIMYYNKDGNLQFSGNTGLNLQIFMGKIDPYGYWEWSVYIDSTQLVNNSTLTIDCYNNVYLGGRGANNTFPNYYGRDGNLQLTGRTGTNLQIFLGKLANDPYSAKNIGVIRSLDLDNNQATVQFWGKLETPIGGITGTNLENGLDYFILCPTGTSLEAGLTTMSCTDTNCKNRCLGVACNYNEFLLNPEQPVCIQNKGKDGCNRELSEDVLLPFSKRVGLDNLGGSNFTKGDLVAFTQSNIKTTQTVHKLLCEQWEWSVSIGNTGSTDNIVHPSIAIDSCNNIYIAGVGPSNGLSRYYNKDNDLDLQGILTSTRPIFVGKVNPNGYWEWTATIDSETNDQTPKIATNPCTTGNVYVCGNSTGTPTYYNSNGTTGLIGRTSTTAQIYMGQLKPTGFWNWSVSISPDVNSLRPNVVADGVGNAYLTGTTIVSGTPVYYDRNGNTGLVGRTSSSAQIFMGRVNSNGYWDWAVSIDNFTANPSVTVDCAGNVYLAGNGAINTQPIFYDRNGNSQLMGRTGNTIQIFMGKVNQNGFWEWDVSIDSSVGTIFPSVSSDQCGNIFLAGTFNITNVGPQYYNRDHNLGLNGYTTTLDETQIYMGKTNISGYWEWSVSIVAFNNSSTPAIRNSNVSNDGCGNSYLGGIGNMTTSIRLYNRENTLQLSLGVVNTTFYVALGKVNPDGFWEWAVYIDSQSSSGVLFDSFPGLGVDYCGNIYLSAIGAPSGLTPDYYNRNGVLGITGRAGDGAYQQMYMGKLANEARSSKRIGFVQKVYPDNTATIQFGGNVSTPIGGESSLTSGSEYFIRCSSGTDLSATVTTDSCNIYNCPNRCLGTSCGANSLLFNLGEPLCQNQKCYNIDMETLTANLSTVSNSYSFTNGVATSPTNWTVNSSVNFTYDSVSSFTYTGDTEIYANVLITLALGITGTYLGLETLNIDVRKNGADLCPTAHGFTGSQVFRNVDMNMLTRLSPNDVLTPVVGQDNLFGTPVVPNDYIAKSICFSVYTIPNATN